MSVCFAARSPLEAGEVIDLLVEMLLTQENSLEASLLHLYLTWVLSSGG